MAWSGLDSHFQRYTNDQSWRTGDWGLGWEGLEILGAQTASQACLFSMGRTTAGRVEGINRSGSIREDILTGLPE